MDKRLLTPAEAVLLLAPTGASAKKCLEAALMSLIDSGRITVEQSPGRSKQAALLLTAPTAAAAVPLPAHLAVVEQALTGYGKGNRLVASQVRSALCKRFGHDFARYVHREVAPSLMSRALLSRTDSKWLGLFPRTVYCRLAPGDALVTPLERLMVEVERVPALIRSDPGQALRLARSAGVLLILSPAARRRIPKLRKLLAARGNDGASVNAMPLASDRLPKWDVALELGDMALGFDLMSLLDGVDVVAKFTSGGDGGSSDSSDDGGGGD